MVWSMTRKDAVAGGLEPGVEPERAGQRVGGVEVDREPLMVLGASPVDGGLDQSASDNTTAGLCQGRGRPDVGDSAQGLPT